VLDGGSWPDVLYGRDDGPVFSRTGFAVPTIAFMALVIPEVLTETCATRQALERFASKWRVLVIYALLDGPQRHAALRRRLEGITQKVLTHTLREMEADAMVERRVLKQTAPMHVEYALTPLGKTLQEPLAAICAWAQAAAGPEPGPQ
jgi:DNA-binding HxlR family transcriptional regulator